MRVVGGNFRGRRIEAPNSQDVRPTSDRAREAIFNMLFSLGLPAGCSVADIFAGSGALGIEALSRGATSAVFIDSSREACAAIEKNLESLGAEAKIVRGDCLREMPSKNVDLVFADPPYGFEAWSNYWIVPLSLFGLLKATGVLGLLPVGKLCGLGVMGALS